MCARVLCREMAGKNAGDMWEEVGEVVGAVGGRGEGA